MTFFSQADNPQKTGRSGVKLREVAGDGLTLVQAELAEGNVVPAHRHDVEVAGWVVQGTISLRIGSESRDLVAGDMYVIPVGVDHSAEAGPEGVTVVEVFASARIDPTSDVLEN